MVQEWTASKSHATERSRYFCYMLVSSFTRTMDIFSEYSSCGYDDSISSGFLMQTLVASLEYTPDPVHHMEEEEMLI